MKKLNGKLLLVVTMLVFVFPFTVYGDVESMAVEETAEFTADENEVNVELMPEESTEFVTEEITEETTELVTEVTTEEITQETTELITISQNIEITETTTENTEILNSEENQVLNDVVSALAEPFGEVSGLCGPNANYTLKDTNGDGAYDKLIIGGTGEIYDFGQIFNVLKSPWSSSSSTITSVVIEDGITYIGARTFAHFTGLKGIEIPKSVTSAYEYSFIGSYSPFYNCKTENLYCYKDSYADTVCAGLIEVNSVKYISDNIKIQNTTSDTGEYSFKVIINSAGFGGSDLSSLYADDFSVVVNDETVDLSNVQYYDDGENMIIPVTVTSSSGDYSQYSFRAQIDAMAHKTPNSAVTQYVSSSFEF